MKRLDLTLSPILNLALDDALIENAEASGEGEEVLRFWESASPAVVLGRSSPFSTEVNREYCDRHDIPVFRRISGGQSIVTAPGCLMYAVLLDYRARPQLRSLDQAHAFVIQQLQNSLTSIGLDTEMEGTCDLTFEGRKFSGNALRCRRNWLLYHGTILCQDFDLSLIPNCLGPPKRKPDYRGERSHDEFVTTIPVATQQAKEALAAAWDAVGAIGFVPLDLAVRLAAEKYATADWLQKVP